MNKVQRILAFAMRMEKDAQEFYSYYADKVSSESLKKLFHELAEIEKNHYEYLNKKHDQLDFKEPPLSISWVVDNAFAAVDPHILADSSDLIGNVPEGSSDLTIIRMAYLIENDFAEFYMHASEAVDDNNAGEFLRTLAQWEDKHRDMFYDRYKVLLKNHWEDITSIIFAEK